MPSPAFHSSDSFLLGASTISPPRRWMLLGRFIHNSITFEEGSAGGMVRSGCSRGPKSRLRGMHFPIPLAHRQLKQFPVQTLLYDSSPGEYCDDLHHLSTSSHIQKKKNNSFELFTLKAVTSTAHIWCFNDISGFLKKILFECDKTANINSICLCWLSVLGFQNVTFWHNWTTKTVEQYFAESSQSKM